MTKGPVTGSLTVALAQLNMLVGDIEGNAQKIITTTREQADAGADLVVFPELALTGYPPEDLLLRPDLMVRVNAQLDLIAQVSHKA
ncbi:MAG: nitrilase-related carbon-nitrogen hydrolase, partial [Plesiomonas shigelloides]